jgi:hypothetical protein
MSQATELARLPRTKLIMMIQELTVRKRLSSFQREQHLRLNEMSNDKLVEFLLQLNPDASASDAR